MNTTIQIKERTRKRLQEHKFSERQSYDEVLNRILDEVEDEAFSDEEIEDLREALLQVKQGKLHRIEDVAAELGVRL